MGFRDAAFSEAAFSFINDQRHRAANLERPASVLMKRQGRQVHFNVRGVP